MSSKSKEKHKPKSIASSAYTPAEEFPDHHQSLERSPASSVSLAHVNPVLGRRCHHVDVEYVRTSRSDTPTIGTQQGMKVHLRCTRPSTRWTAFDYTADATSAFGDLDDDGQRVEPSSSRRRRLRQSGGGEESKVTVHSAGFCEEHFNQWAKNKWKVRPSWVIADTIEDCITPPTSPTATAFPPSHSPPRGSAGHHRRGRVHGCLSDSLRRTSDGATESYPAAPRGHRRATSDGSRLRNILFSLSEVESAQGESYWRVVGVDDDEAASQGSAGSSAGR